MNGPARKAPVLNAPYELITDDTAGRAGFDYLPSQVVVLATLELSVVDEFGPYLLVTSPRYDVHRGGSIEPQWGPPYVAHTVAMPKLGWVNVGQVREKLAQVTSPEGIDDWRPQAALEEVVATWACGISDVKLIGQLTEYKRSWTAPEQLKIYHVMRFRPVTNTCITKALADPESRKGFSFLPIDSGRYATAVRRRDCPRHGRQELMFIGRPIASNLEYVLEDKKARDGLQERAIEIDPGDFYGDQNGILVCGDIANYGAACGYARDHMDGIKFDEEPADTVLRNLATSAIARVFHDAGLSQVHTAGDGFIAAIPAGSQAECQAVLADFMTAYGTLVRLLDDVNERIATHHTRERRGRKRPPVLGSRLAIHHGPYRYGKMAQAASLLTGFDGAAVIDVARLEQGLRAIVKKPERAAAVGLKDVAHTVAVSAAARKAIGAKGLIAYLSGKGTRAKAESKEAVARLTSTRTRRRRRPHSRMLPERPPQQRPRSLIAPGRGSHAGARR